MLSKGWILPKYTLLSLPKESDLIMQHLSSDSNLWKELRIYLDEAYIVNERHISVIGRITWTSKWSCCRGYIEALQKLFQCRLLKSWKRKGKILVIMGWKAIWKFKCGTGPWRMTWCVQDITEIRKIWKEFSLLSFSKITNNIANVIKPHHGMGRQHRFLDLSFRAHELRCWGTRRSVFVVQTVSAFTSKESRLRVNWRLVDMYFNAFTCSKHVVLEYVLSALHCLTSGGYVLIHRLT